MENKWIKCILRSMSYLLVAVMATCLTLAFSSFQGGTGKLAELERLITERFIGEAEETKLLDAAADAMVTATGDRWSYYIPAAEFQAYMEQMNNSYVGIGVTISGTVGTQGVEILKVDPKGGAAEAGILPGDIMVAVNGQSVVENGIDQSKELIRGEANTAVEIRILRNGETLSFSVMRKEIQMVVAKGQMLENQIGLVRIANFDERCAQETIAAIEDLISQGAKALIFDVRNNPGGYKRELVQVLDYLLPEGEIFHSLNYQGEEEVTRSDADCLKLPMAVLVNADSYSAAEFFAAALKEYDYATVIGEQTVGKGYFQETYRLRDGSAVALSVGKYFTPQGMSLAEVGGLTPDVVIQVEEEMAAQIYAELLEPENDPQIQGAVQALLEK